MKILNRIIQGAKKMIFTDETPETIEVTYIEFHQPSESSGLSKPYNSREEAIAAAKAEIDAKIKAAKTH